MSEPLAVSPHMDSIRPDDGVDRNRRRFLIAAIGVVGAGGVGLFASTFVESMNPGYAVKALGEPVDVDVSKIEPGQLLVVQWKQKPVWVLHRTAEMLKTLDNPDLLSRLRDPKSEAAQQPSAKYVNGNYRAIKPDILVAVALCTHMQCVPDFRPAPHSVTTWWYGGFHCPCHGSMYDFSARVFEGSPAPMNIPIPPYYWRSGSVVRIGEENGQGSDENWSPSIW